MKAKWELARTVQCAKCPWRATVNPHEIPNGYSPDKHRALANTIARPDDLTQLLAGRMRVMACHEEHAAHCIGWLMNQVGPGNNIALRLSLRSCTNINEVKLLGAQHETFEETLPVED